MAVRHFWGKFDHNVNGRFTGLATTARMKLPLLILGPTASGKSHLAMQIAQQIPAEIISIDSAQVYRQMDIGTAKPSALEREQVVHHLIDILEPTQSYSTAQFLTDCHALITQIQGRHKLPMIVGGTMLYARALLQGLDALPPADPAIRAALDQEAANLGWPALHQRLTVIDPATALRLPSTDSQRIQRALEVYAISGKPMSSFFGQTAIAPIQCKTVSIEPLERADLHGRIAQRFDAMLAQGLVDEVKQLRARGDLHLGLPSMRCVGYRQVWEYLDLPDSMPALRERAVAAARQLAKRQLTWLRSLPIDLRLPMARSDSPQERHNVERVIADAIATKPTVYRP
jgi:tRNA dimethylallyltransferase